MLSPSRYSSITYNTNKCTCVCRLNIFLVAADGNNSDSQAKWGTSYLRKSLEENQYLFNWSLFHSLALPPTSTALSDWMRESVHRYSLIAPSRAIPWLWTRISASRIIPLCRLAHEKKTWPPASLLLSTNFFELFCKFTLGYGVWNECLILKWLILVTHLWYTVAYLPNYK